MCNKGCHKMSTMLRCVPQNYLLTPFFYFYILADVIHPNKSYLS